MKRFRIYWEVRGYDETEAETREEAEAEWAEDTDWSLDAGDVNVTEIKEIADDEPPDDSVDVRPLLSGSRNSDPNCDECEYRDECKAANGEGVLPGIDVEVFTDVESLEDDDEDD
jgi:hypothetical protein